MSFGRRIAIATGILLMVFAGGCSLLFAGTSLVQIISDPGGYGIAGLVFAFIYGAIPFAVGLAIFIRARKPSRRQP